MGLNWGNTITVLTCDKKPEKNGQPLTFLIQIIRNFKNPGSQPMQFLISELDLRDEISGVDELIFVGNSMDF